MSDPIGFVVIEYNQASRQPDLSIAPALHRAEGDAAAEMAHLEAETAATGRRERYALAEVRLIEREDESDDLA